MRRGFALTTVVALGSAFAALPGSVASGDATGGASAPPAPAPSAPPASDTAPTPAPSFSGANGSGKAAPAPASPGHPTVGKPAGAVVGQIVTLDGIVNEADAGRAVVVQQRTAAGGWGDVGTIASGSDGSFSVRWRPISAGPVALRAALAGTDGAHAADTAPEVDLTVFKRTRATWYGPGDYGNRTACGQKLTATMLGVAHKSLPCGTKVQLFYGGRTVTVPVIDRGPYANGASFDLTKTTADQLGVDGVFSLGYAIIK